MHAFTVIAYGDHAKFARPVVRTAINVAFHHDPAADAGTNSDADKALIVPARAAPAFAQRRAVGVVFRRDGQVRQLGEQFAEILVIEIIECAGLCRLARVGVDMTRKLTPIAAISCAF